MSFKQFLIKQLSLFFMLTTLITLAVVVLGSAFDGEARFGYEALLSPMTYAGCCVLPGFVTFSRKEPKPRELLLRRALRFVLTEAVVLFLAWRSPVVDSSRPIVMLTIAGSVLVIFLLVLLIDWLTNTAEAKKTNAELLEFQRLHGADSASA
jgi:hypothetical protein